MCPQILFERDGGKCAGFDPSDGHKNVPCVFLRPCGFFGEAAFSGTFMYVRRIENPFQIFLASRSVSRCMMQKVLTPAAGRRRRHPFPFLQSGEKITKKQLKLV